MSSDHKFFQRGKAQELRAELSATDRKDKSHAKKRIVLKKIVANMTMSNDMSSLFPDIIHCMSIAQLEIKKMCFLFLINYARIKPDMAQRTLPILLADLQDPNPLLRALALRTMSYIHVKDINTAMVAPLKKLLADNDPYVRKTAAICVAKLYAHDPNLVNDDKDLRIMLRGLIEDSNSTVMANALVSYMDISEAAEDWHLNLKTRMATNMVAAMNECSEWSQVYILEALLYYVPQAPGDAEIIAERVVPRLQHANASVVLSSVKLILYLINYIPDPDEVQGLCKKMSPPLVTLLSKSPEIQFVALRNIDLVLLISPTVLRNDVKVFFCKYNDPIYVKLAKLEIIVKLATKENVEQVLPELREYSTEIDVDFVRKSVRSIGRLAVKLDEAATKCVEVLLELVATKVTYVVQEVTVVIRDIFRRYPNRYESIISTLCQHLDSLDEPEAKAAMIWIIGQYADRIENAGPLLNDFLYTFLEETTEVQLALLTATVKLFILRPTMGQDLVPKVLKWATEESDQPDVRDRGYMYWRLLSTNLKAARQVVIGEGRTVTLQSDDFDSRTTEELSLNLGTLSSIYHRVPSAFLRTNKAKHLVDSPVMQNKARPSMRRATTMELNHTHKSASGKVIPNTLVTTVTRNPYADFMQVEPSPAMMNGTSMDVPSSNLIDL